MNSQYLITSASAVLAAFSIWCFVDGVLVSNIEFISAVIYLLLATTILFKIRYTRYLALGVLGVHIAFALFMLYMAITTDVPSPEEIEEFSQRLENLPTNEEYSTAYVFMSSERKRYLILREITVLLPLFFCVYALTNSAVANLFKGRKA